MIRNGFKHVDEQNNDYRFVITNTELHRICATSDVSDFVKDQQQKYVSHVIRMDSGRNVKRLTFNDDKFTKKGRPVKSLLDLVVEEQNTTVANFCNSSMKKKNDKKTV